MPKQKQLTFSFDRVPLLRQSMCAWSAPITGDAVIEYDVQSRGWSILMIRLKNEAEEAPIDRFTLIPDLGEDACGPYELVHDALLCECEEAIGAVVDRAIDGGQANG